MRLGDISVAYVELMAKAVRSLGHKPEALLAQYQLDGVRLASPQARISIPRFMRLGHAMMQSYELPSLGLLMGKQSSAPVLGLAGFLAQSAATIQDASQVLAEYELLSSFNARGRSRFFLEDGRGILQFYSISPYNDYNLFVVDSVLSGWFFFLLAITGSKDGIKRIEFEFAPPVYADLYRHYFPGEIRFNASRNALVLEKSFLAKPVLSACASTYAALQQLAARELERVRLGLSFREQTERAISPLLNGNTPTLEQVAQRLNSTPWVVRRRLQAEGVNFQQVLNATRKDLALSYVRDTALSLGEIAFVLGFGSPEAFQRAFKRWTGVAPGRYRLQKNYISTASSTSSS
ncbi:MAG: hypothetical protein RL217_180 [Pseudomonadota bacterium]|jgi:AraC-like DNA-binding protein